MFKIGHHTNKPKRKPQNQKHLPLKLSFLMIIVLGIVTMLHVSLRPPSDDINIAINPSIAPSIATEEDNQANSGFPAVLIRAIVQVLGGIPAQIEAPDPVVVRAEPRVDTVTLGQLSNGTVVTALEQSHDGVWIRVAHHDLIQPGWIFVQFVIVPGNTENLPVIDS